MRPQSQLANFNVIVIIITVLIFTRATHGLVDAVDARIVSHLTCSDNPNIT